MKGRGLGFLPQRRSSAVAGGPGEAMPTDGAVRPSRALARLYARLGDLAVEASDRPGAAVGILLLLNLGLAAVLAPLGYLATGDRALFYRELMPGTWLSFGQLVFVSAIAWAAHERGPRPRQARQARGWRRYDDFWAMSAAVFLVLAVDEITQATMFLSKWVGSTLAVSAPAPFTDLDAVFLVLLLAVCGIVAVRRAVVLLRHRRALALLSVAVLLGVASQALDSLVPTSEWETVAEDSLKLAAAPFFVGGYLAALGDVLRWGGQARNGAGAWRG